MGYENTENTTLCLSKQPANESKAGSRKKEEELIYCVDSRLVLGGGASKTFSCFGAAILFVSTDNDMYLAKDLKQQLMKFQRPRLDIQDPLTIKYRR